MLIVSIEEEEKKNKKKNMQHKRSNCTLLFYSNDRSELLFILNWSGNRKTRGSGGMCMFGGVGDEEIDGSAKSLAGSDNFLSFSLLRYVL